MPALKAIMEGDSTPLQKELAKVEAIANGSARRMSSTIFNPTSKTSAEGGYAAWWSKALKEQETATASSMAGGHAKAGAMREAVVLVRELARGDLKRAGSSATILVQQLGLLKFVLNPVTGIIAGLVAGFAAAYTLTQHLVEKLSGLKMPDFHPEYIAKHLTKLGQIAEAHREIGREIERTAELYNSAAKAAERQAEAVKAQFDHQRKMNDAAEELEMNKAKARGASEKEIQDIRKKYSDMNLDLQKKENEAQIQMTRDQIQALKQESVAKSEEADKIARSMPSKAADENTMKDRRQQAEEAQKYLDEIAKNPKGSMRDKILRGYNAVALSGVSGNDLDAAAAANKAEAQRRIKAHNDFVDEAHARDVQRKRMEQLNKDAEEAAKRATELGQGLPHQQQMNAQQEANAQAEAAAKLAAQAALQHSFSNGSVSSLQRIGGYIGPTSGNSLLDVNKGMHQQLKEINAKLGKAAEKGNRAPLGGVVY